MPIHLIVAINNTYSIGLNGNLLYRLKKDLNHFREITTGHTVVMGKNTYLEIGRALPNRRNIVLSRSSISLPEGVELCHDFHSLLEQYKHNDEIFFVIGGAEIYKQALPYVDKAYITKIDDDKYGDTFFPYEYIAKHFNTMEQTKEVEGDFNFEFVEFVRREDVGG